ncbi:MAG: helix-turn-helix domain-containing protein [Promethearchaeota archaeon]|jgi:transcriptional regulator with XRE-family HTH domain
MNLKNLVKIRKQKRWSQEKMAVESGISYNTIIKIERGGIENPKIETVIKLADALDVSLDELVGRSKKKNSRIIKSRGTY